jgi:hypothetical protein
MSRFNDICPVCGGTIQPHQIPVGEPFFQCPICGESLKFAQPHSLAMWISSIIGSPIISYAFGLRGFALVITAAIGVPILYLVMGFFMGLGGTAKLKRVLPEDLGANPRDGDVSLQLRDKPRR